MILKGISRVNEFVDPELLQDSEVTELKNLVVDGGIAKKRGAVKSYNTSSSGGTIKDLYELDGYVYGNIDVGATRTLKKLNTTWSTVKSGLSDIGLNMQRHNDVGIFTNGVDDMFTVQNGTAYNYIISAPEVEDVTLDLATGGSLDATSWYSYKLVYVTDTGVASIFSQTMNIQTSTNKTVTFEDLPVSSDTRVTGRKLYRTEGNAQTFYLVATLDNVETDYSDSLADENLGVSEVIDYLVEVNTSKTICTHKSRLILGNVTATNAPNIYPWRIIAENDGTGSNLTGTYTYGISLTMVNGTETGIVATSETTIVSGAGAIDYSPSDGSDISDVAGVNIYRSKNGGLYYLVGSYSAKSGSIEDNTATLSTVYPAVNSTAFETVSTPSRVYYSEIDKPQEIPQLNYIDVYPDDDEEIIGVVDQEDGILVFKEKSIYFIYTSGSPYNWRVVRLVENLGCSDVRSIQRAKNTVYFKYNNDIYRFPDMKIISQEFNNTLNGVTINDTAYVSKYNWYVIVSSNKMYIYDERNGTWLYFNPDDTSYSSAIETVDGDFYIGHLILMKYDTSTSLDYNESRTSNEDTISSSIKSKHYITTPNQEFRLRKLFSRFNKGAGSVTEKLIDPISSGYKSVIHSGTGWKELKQVTDSMTGSLKTSHVIRYEISGDIVEFSNMRLETNLRNRNRIWS